MFHSKIGSLFQQKKRKNRFSLAHYFAACAPFSLLARFFRSSTLTDSLAQAIRSDVSLTFETIHLKQDTALLILITVWSIYMYKHFSKTEKHNTATFLYLFF